MQPIENTGPTAPTDDEISAIAEFSGAEKKKLLENIALLRSFAMAQSAVYGSRLLWQLVQLQKLCA
jgi:hypothetical protein